VHPVDISGVSDIRSEDCGGKVLREHKEFKDEELIVQKTVRTGEKSEMENLFSLESEIRF